MSFSVEPKILSAIISICGVLIGIVGAYLLYHYPNVDQRNHSIPDNSEKEKQQIRSELGLTMAISGLTLTAIGAVILLMNF